MRPLAMSAPRPAPTARRLAGVLLAAAVLRAAPLRAEPGELERLRAENARLVEQVRALEAERDGLLERCPPPMAAAVERAANERVEVHVNEAGGGADGSTDRTRLERTRGGVSKHWLTVHAHRGEAGTIERASLEIDADASGGIYREVHAVELTIDGRRTELPVADYRRENLVTSSRMPRAVGVAESLTVALPPEVLARLADAREVTGTIGGTTVRLSAEQLLAVRALVQRLAAR